MKKAVVTGANGFVGSAVVKELLNNNIEVIALDKEYCNNNIPKEANFISCDLANISDITQAISQFNPDTYYHFAWVGVKGPFHRSCDAQLENIRWSINALNHAKKIGCERFIFAGSITEQEANIAAFEQGGKPDIGYLYGYAKTAAMAMCKAIAADVGIDFIYAKISNIYGEPEVSSGIISSTLNKIIKKEPLLFTAGTQNYDFIHINDVAKAFRMLGEKGKPFHNYLIGSGHAKPLKEFLEEIKDVTKCSDNFQYGAISFKGVSVPIEMFDCSEIRNDVGFAAEISFKEGIERTMEWIKENNNV